MVEYKHECTLYQKEGGCGNKPAYVCYPDRRTGKKNLTHGADHEQEMKVIFRCERDHLPCCLPLGEFETLVLLTRIENEEG